MGKYKIQCRRIFSYKYITIVLDHFQHKKISATVGVGVDSGVGAAVGAGLGSNGVGAGLGSGVGAYREERMVRWAECRPPNGGIKLLMLKLNGFQSVVTFCRLSQPQFFYD